MYFCRCSLNMHILDKIRRKVIFAQHLRPTLRVSYVRTNIYGRIVLKQGLTIAPTYICSCTHNQKSERPLHVIVNDNMYGYHQLYLHSIPP